MREVLENWDQDSEGALGCEQFTLLDALLLHEVVELWLWENDPEMEEQLAAMSAFLDDDESPDDLDEDVDDLPVDSVALPKKKKKKVAKAKPKEVKADKSKEGKLFRTKDGQYYRIVDGKKVPMHKKKK